MEVRRKMAIEIRAWGEEEEDRQRWRTEGEREVVMYMDGSNKEGTGGVRVCRIGKNNRMKGEECYGTGKRMEIMDIKMMGIKKGIERGLKECEKEGASELTIRLDSQQAIRRSRIRDATAGKHMAHQVRKAWEIARGKGVKVRLAWVKEHSKKWGNERADELVDRERGKSMDNDECVSFSWLEAESRRETIRQWESAFQREGTRKGTVYFLTSEMRHGTRNDPGERTQKVLISRL